MRNSVDLKHFLKDLIGFLKDLIGFFEDSIGFLEDVVGFLDDLIEMHMGHIRSSRELFISLGNSINP